MVYLNAAIGRSVLIFSRQIFKCHSHQHQAALISTYILPHSSVIRNKYTLPYHQFDHYHLSLFPRSPNSTSHYGLHVLSVRSVHQSASNCDKEPSKVEQTVKHLKENLQKSKQESVVSTITDEDLFRSVEKPIIVAPAPKKTLLQRIVAEVKHYYHGFRLLFIDIRVSTRLLWNVLNGENLSRREHKQLVRTVSDLFRIVPFSVFIIIPFMEFLLPVALKLFPNMLPSTFQNLEAKQKKMKKQLKVKLEMAKFLQDTLDEMALQSSGDKSSEKAKEFANFFLKIRESGEQASNDEILKFSKLFEDEITLDNMPRPQLIALCKLLELQPLGTNNFLRFQLRMRLRNLLADDKMIKMEGINSLSVDELQLACKSRGMRAMGITTERLRSQLSQWLELSLNEKIPPSLLLLSRALYLPENLQASDQLKATISSLPDSVATEAMYKIGEKEGKVHNKTKLDIIKKEEEAIKREKEEELESARVEKQAEPTVAPEVIQDQVPNIPVDTLEIHETLVDTAPILADKATKVEEKLSQEDFENLEDALDNIAVEKEKLWIEKEELEDLKEDMAEYKEDIEELVDIKVLSGEPEKSLRESKAATRLKSRVNSMIGRLDTRIAELQKQRDLQEEKINQEEEMEKPDEVKQQDDDKYDEFNDFKKEKDDIVNIAELVNAMKKIKTSSDETRLAVIAQLLDKLDYDQDGAVKIEDVLKVIETIGNEQVKIDPNQMEEIIDLLEKEESLGFAEKIEKQIEREQRHQEAAATKELTEEEQEMLDAVEQEEKAAGGKNEDSVKSHKKEEN